MVKPTIAKRNGRTVKIQEKGETKFSEDKKFVMRDKIGETTAQLLKDANDSSKSVEERLDSLVKHLGRIEGINLEDDK